MVIFRIHTGTRRRAMRFRISRLPSPRPRRRESRYWLLPTLPTSAQQPWCNSQVDTLLRSTRSPANRTDVEQTHDAFFPMLAVVSLVALVSVQAQSVSSDIPDAPDRSIKSLREDEDWSFLANPANRQDFWDPVKYIR